MGGTLIFAQILRREDIEGRLGVSIICLVLTMNNAEEVYYIFLLQAACKYGLTYSNRGLQLATKAAKQVRIVDALCKPYWKRH